MKKTWKSSVLLLGTAMLGAVALSGTNAGAIDNPVTLPVVISAEVTSSIAATTTQEMDFGIIDLAPGGDTITINAGGPNGGVAATPDPSGLSVITGTGTSAVITVTGAAGFNIDVEYEADDTVELSDGTTTVKVNKIDLNSGGGTSGGTVTHLGEDVETLIHVGGEIELPAGATTGAYTGTMDVILTFS